MGRPLDYETLRSISIAGVYATLGTPLAKQATLVKFINETTAGVFISINGTTDVDYIPANGFALYDVTTNGVNTKDSLFYEAGRQYYVKGTGAGNVYLVVQYIK